MTVRCKWKSFSNLIHHLVDGVAIRNPASDCRQLPYSRAKARGKVRIRLLCMLNLRISTICECM